MIILEISFLVLTSTFSVFFFGWLMWGRSVRKSRNGPFRKAVSMNSVWLQMIKPNWTRECETQKAIKKNIIGWIRFGIRVYKALRGVNFHTTLATTFGSVGVRFGGFSQVRRMSRIFRGSCRDGCLLLLLFGFVWILFFLSGLSVPFYLFGFYSYIICI